METSETPLKPGGLNSRIALTIVVLASFSALSTIKSGNVAQAIEQAQAERNNGWAWYQAVRVREDMATYELASLQRLVTQREASAAEVTAQEGEVGRVRERLEETRGRAQAAEAQIATLSVFDDQYDLSHALIAIAISMLGVAALVQKQWLFWVGLVPAVSGLFWGLAAMFRIPIAADIVFAWLQ